MELIQQQKDIEYLLNQVVSINQKVDELSKLKGEHFNIFSILGLEPHENKTHSNFLATLLNPQGVHGLGDVFLHHFFEVLQISNELDQLKRQYFEVRTELSFDNGRIDIVIQSEDMFIAIENKIYAGDQDKQIERYYNHAASLNKKHFVVYYLTLDGKEASKESKVALVENTDYYPIAYGNEIKAWLELCLKEVYDLPIIRETIKQYLILIKKLTGQLTNQKMDQELISLIAKDEQTLQAAEIIASNYQKAVQRLKIEEVALFIQQLERVGINATSINIEKALRKEGDGIFIEIKEYTLENKEVYELGLQFEFDNNYYFFCVIEQGGKRKGNNHEKKFDPIRKELHGKIQGLTSDNAWWIGKGADFKIGIDKNTYFLHQTNNEAVYASLAQKVKDILDGLKD